jgi:DTW domain-containing protein YfiP
MRDKCQECLKVRAACYCGSIKPYFNCKNIIILMHPSEKDHALGTARMAKLTFKNISLYIGEDFTEDKELLRAIKSARCAVFRPSEQALSYEKTYPNFDTLIFLDGTWKKANKIFFLNSFLHDLPQLTFESGAKSRYRLRKEPKESYLSTFESIIKAFEISDKKDLSSHLDPLEFAQNFQESQARQKLL